MYTSWPAITVVQSLVRVQSIVKVNWLRPLLIILTRFYHLLSNLFFFCCLRWAFCTSDSWPLIPCICRNWVIELPISWSIANSLQLKIVHQYKHYWDSTSVNVYETLLIIHPHFPGLPAAFDIVDPAAKSPSRKTWISRGFFLNHRGPRSNIWKYPIRFSNWGFLKNSILLYIKILHRMAVFPSKDFQRWEKKTEQKVCVVTGWLG